MSSVSSISPIALTVQVEIKMEALEEFIKVSTVSTLFFNVYNHLVYHLR